MNISLREECEKLNMQLKSEQSSFTNHWRDLCDYILPRRGRFFSSDNNKGDRRNKKIIDSTSTLASRTLRSGMMSGVTSPARPWFRLTTQNPVLAEIQTVKDWLDKVTRLMSATMLKSNLYNALPIIYGDMGVFGTGALLVEEDFETTVRFYPFPIGSYRISNNSKLKVDTFARDFRLTVRQLVEKFAEQDMQGNYILDKFSDYVQNLWAQCEYEVWIDVAHVIKPNYNFRRDKLDSKFKKYISIYYEAGTSSKQGGSYLKGTDREKVLSEKGYDLFPVLCPRWEITGEDAYGTNCPGMIALGDIKQLQFGEKTSAKAIEKQVDPPMVGSTSLKNTKASIIPGDITYVDEINGQQAFREAHQVRLDINALEMKQEQVRQRIKKAFYEDLFLMLASMDRRQITATEINERHEEKLLALGPVLEQLNQDLLDPLIDIVFDILLKQGLIPEPPEELHGEDLKIDYLSVMSQAQKLVGLSAIERFTGFVGQVAQANPNVLDKIDADQLIDVYSEITSIPTGIVRSDESVAALRSERAEAQRAQEQAMQMQQSIGAMKDLGDTKISKDGALGALLDGTSRL